MSNSKEKLAEEKAAQIKAAEEKAVEAKEAAEKSAAEVKKSEKSSGMYRVKALSCTGKGKSIFKLNDIIPGFKFNNPEELEKLGFLEKQG